MTLGIFLGLIISLYLLIVVPKKKFGREVSIANEKLDAVIECIDLSQDQHTIDEKIANEIKKLARTDKNLNLLNKREQKINILMAKIR